MAKLSVSPPGIMLFWSLDCKLMPLHNTCQSLPAICYMTSSGCGWSRQL